MNVFPGSQPAETIKNIVYPRKTFLIEQSIIWLEQILKDQQSVRFLYSIVTVNWTRFHFQAENTGRIANIKVKNINNKEIKLFKFPGQ